MRPKLLLCGSHHPGMIRSSKTHSHAHLAGIFHTLGKASTDHIILDSPWGQAVPHVGAVEGAACLGINDWHLQLLEGLGGRKANCNDNTMQQWTKDPYNAPSGALLTATLPSSSHFSISFFHLLTFYYCSETDSLFPLTVSVSAGHPFANPLLLVSAPWFIQPCIFETHSQCCPIVQSCVMHRLWFCGSTERVHWPSSGES